MPPKSKEHSASPVEKENPAEQKSLGRTVLRLVGGDSEPTSINIKALDHNSFVKEMAELALQGPFTMMDVFAAAGIPDSPINRADYEEQLPRFMREILAALGEDYSWEESQESAESAEPTTTEAELFTEAAQRVMSDKPGAGRLSSFATLVKDLPDRSNRRRRVRPRSADTLTGQELGIDEVTAMIKGYFGADSTEDSSQPKSVTKKAFLEFLTAQLHFSGNDTPEMLFQKLRDQGTIHTTGLGGRVHVLGGRKPSSDEEAVAKPETAGNRDDFTLEDITQGQHILEAIVRLGTNPSSGKRHQESGATEGQIVNSTPEVSAGTKEMLQKLRRTGIIETYTPSNGSGIKYRITADYFKEFYTTSLRSILQTLQR